MSMFLPESSNLSGPAQPGATQITPTNPETTSEDVKLMQRVFTAAMQNPNLIPDQFMAYVLDWIQTQRLIIPIGQVFGYRSVAGIRGSVSATGSILTGTGFSISKTTTGTYGITFDSAFADTPNVLAIVADNLARFATANGVSETGATILTWDTSGSLHDVAFLFWAFSAKTL